MELYLNNKLKTYGTPVQVKSTIQRIKETNNWSDFLYNYPYGTHINPFFITKIVEEYYENLPEPTFAEKNGLVFIEEKIINTYNPLFDQTGQELWYVYKDKSGNIFKHTEPYN